MLIKLLHWDQEEVLEELEPAGFAVATVEVEVEVEEAGEGTPPLVAPSSHPGASVAICRRDGLAITLLTKKIGEDTPGGTAGSSLLSPEAAPA
jgi:hypothetical protein